MLNHKQRLELLMNAKLKGVKQKNLAELIGKSNAWISVYFAGKENLNDSHEQMIIDYINNK